MTAQGHCHPQFERVQEAFELNFRRGDETGAAVSVWLDGEPVVDLHGGKQHSGKAWKKDDLMMVFSVTKGLVAIAINMLIDQKLLDLDKPVSHYWPEFAQNGKEQILVRDMLNHVSGLSVIKSPIRLEAFAEPEQLTELLQAQSPIWKPGSEQGYGATAFGIWTQALFLKITGSSLGEFIRQEIAGPLGADFYLGLTAQEQARVRPYKPPAAKAIAKVIGPHIARGTTSEGRMYRSILGKPGSITRAAFINPRVGRKGLNRLNDADTQTWQLPWVNGHATASGLAKIYAAMACEGALGDKRLLSAKSVAPLHQIQSWSDEDRVLRKPLGFTQGFVKEESRLFSPHPEAFGHPGAGGALGWADPKRRLSIGYVTNQMDPLLRSPRCLSLCHAAYQSLGDLPD